MKMFDCASNYLFVLREEARNMWQTQEDQWKSGHVIRQNAIDDLFATIKNQVCITCNIM